MATLRDTLQSEIVMLEAALAAKKTDLESLESVAPDWLGQEIDKIKQFFNFTAVKQKLGL
jgi:CYTH domain-containing protein